MSWKSFPLQTAENLTNNGLKSVPPAPNPPPPPPLSWNSSPNVGGSWLLAPGSCCQGQCLGNYLDPSLTVTR